jgi:hypothetical protein
LENKRKNNLNENTMKYTIGIKELIKRPIIRNDHSEEYMNKMTDEEILQWEAEIDQSLLAEGVDKKFPDWNAAFLAKIIDRSILYNLMKLGES